MFFFFCWVGNHKLNISLFCILLMQQRPLLLYDFSVTGVHHLGNHKNSTYNCATYCQTKSLPYLCPARSNLLCYSSKVQPV